MKRVLALEEGPGFGGALMSLKYLLENADPNSYLYYLISNYPQDYIKQNNNIKDVHVLPRKRIYGANSLLEKNLRLLVGRKAGPAAYVIDRFTYCNRYVNKVATYIKENNIDLVHLNNWPLLNDGGLFAAKKAGVPVVMHIRGMEYGGRLIGWLVNQADQVIVISEYIKTLICQLGISPDKISIIPNAVDAKIFIQSAKGKTFRSEFGIDPQVKLIGMAGCLVDWKGHKEFLEACSMVFRTTPSTQCLVVGDTPDGSTCYKIELEEYAKNLGIFNRVHFVGHRKDISSAMDACDVLVHASTTPEPFGRVIIEAMALGKPVVATAPGGPGEIISNGVDGLLVPPSDAMAITSAILRYLNDEKFCRAVGHKASEKVLEKYDASTYAKSVTSVYEKILD